MSLSARLLGASGSKTSIDSDLDALFRSTASAPFIEASTQPHPWDVKKKRKSRGDETNVSEMKRPRRQDRPDLKKTAMISESAGREDRSVSRKGKVKEQERTSKKAEQAGSSEDENDASGLEIAYTGGKIALKEDIADTKHSDEEGDPSQLVHETIAKSFKARNIGSKSKYSPPDETQEQREARTIFVGNLSVEVAQKKTLLKQLHRHILAHVPTAKIESTRFRSVPFQNPTSKLPTSDDEDSPSKPQKHDSKAESSTVPKRARQHDRDRTSLWRADQEESEIKGDDKKFLNPKQKKKIAFINREFHSNADSVNAYIVFSHPAPTMSRPANVPPLEVMDPYQAAKVSAERCDGTLFMERLIRIDLASKNVKAVKNTGGQIAVTDSNPKLSIFVGNVDFACKEEDLRAFFEGVVSGERGPPGEDESENKDGARRPNLWVTRVRIIRDKETQLGKGFAYVQFADRECVDEVLAMDESKLKFAKRKLRVRRCKTLPGGSAASRAHPAVVDAVSTSLRSSRSMAQAVPIPIPSIPKGDPSLGSKLAHLPKDKRKQIKSSDADRVARRLAKKKARNALAKEGVKPQVKDRDRVRKTLAAKKGSAPRKESKGRIRSEKSVAKRNMKK